MCILYVAIQYSVETFGYAIGTEGGGLSGEHIQLCAEGARRWPNLSGKWTEMLYGSGMVFVCADSLPGCLFFVCNYLERRTFLC